MIGLHEFCTARVQELDESLGTYFTKQMRDAVTRPDLVVDALMKAGSAFTKRPLMINPIRSSSWPPELTAIDFLTAEIVAKRRILDRHRSLSQAAPKKVYFDGSNADHCHGCGDVEFDTHATPIDDCPELRDVAAPYNWHFDYKSRWRPE